MLENTEALWGFLGVITAGILGIIGQQIQARRDAKDAKAKAEVAADKAEVAADNAHQAAENTKPVSNGFAGRVDDKLDTIIRQQDALGDSLRDHLQWHLNRVEGGDTK